MRPAERRAGGRPTGVLVTGYFGPHQSLLPITLPTIRRHAERYGHNVVLARPVTDRRLHFDFAKVVMMRGLLATYDVVVWVDGDSVVLDDAPDLSELLAGAEMAVGCDEAGDDYNTSLWALRQGARARGLLDLLWDQRGGVQLDGPQGLLRRVAGQPSSDVHRLDSCPLGLRSRGSARPGQIVGVVHSGAGQGRDIEYAAAALSLVVERGLGARDRQHLDAELDRILRFVLPEVMEAGPAVDDLDVLWGRVLSEGVCRGG
jgi:hypothetical protein